jgi:hypothetical protein
LSGFSERTSTARLLHARSVFHMGLTLPTGIEKRVEDDFAYTFLRLCAEAELCFRPDEAQLGYWFAHKTNTYMRDGDEPHRRGTSVLAPLHIFDVLDIAYTHPVGGFLSQHVQESDICEPYRRCPAHFILDFLCARAVYPRWRLLGASRSRVAPIVSIDNDWAQPDEPPGGFAIASAAKERAHPTHIDYEWLDERKAQTYDDMCATHGKPRDAWLPNCTGPATVEERDYFAFEYDLDDDWYRAAAAEWDKHAARRELW